MEDWYTRTLKWKDDNKDDFMNKYNCNKQLVEGHQGILNHLTLGSWFFSARAVRNEMGAILVGDKDNGRERILSPELVDKFSRLINLINQAPRPSESVRVYRYKIPYKKPKQQTNCNDYDEVIPAPGAIIPSLVPMSTSLSLEFVLAWMLERNDGKFNTCCIYQIDLSAETPCMLLGKPAPDQQTTSCAKQLSAYNEYEVALLPGELRVTGSYQHTFTFADVIQFLTQHGNTSSLLESNANIYNETPYTVTVYTCTYAPFVLYKAPLLTEQFVKECIYAEAHICPELSIQKEHKIEFFKPTATITGGERKKNQPYEKRTVAELRALCISRRIKHTASMRKAELIAALRAKR